MCYVHFHHARLSFTVRSEARTVKDKLVTVLRKNMLHRYMYVESVLTYRSIRNGTNHLNHAHFTAICFLKDIKRNKYRFVKITNRYIYMYIYIRYYSLLFLHMAHSHIQCKLNAHRGLQLALHPLFVAR